MKATGASISRAVIDPRLTVSESAFVERAGRHDIASGECDREGYQFSQESFLEVFLNPFEEFGPTRATDSSNYIGCDIWTAYLRFHFLKNNTWLTGIVSGEREIPSCGGSMSERAS